MISLTIAGHDIQYVVKISTVQVARIDLKAVILNIIKINECLVAKYLLTNITKIVQNIAS